MTKVVRIDLSTVAQLEQAIEDACGNQDFAGFKLVTTFVYQTDLVLIFQKKA